MKNILVTGAQGQIGSELVDVLRRTYGSEQVIATDIHPHTSGEETPYEILDVTDRDRLHDLLETYEIDTVFHLASLLSATGERKPDLAWEVNLNGLKLVLDAAKSYNLQTFWPSSIAVFGPNTLPHPAPQSTILEPNTMYGVTKVAGELLCKYYREHYDVDVRSVRYPGLISHKTQPGGGTTDYAVHIFHEALKSGHYTSFVGPETRLPMMYMPDAIRATLELMTADRSKLTVHTGYNIASVSFSAAELAEAIRVHIPDFTCDYDPDERQAIADSWPMDVDDTSARRDWNWLPKYDMPTLVEDMLKNLRQRLVIAAS